MATTQHYHSRIRKFALVAAAVSVVFGLGACSPGNTDDPAEGGLQSLTLWPAHAAGSGVDQTGRAIQFGFQEEGIISQVEVSPREGGNGTRVISEIQNADATTLAVASFGQIGATIAGNTQFTLMDTTPIARMAGEAGTIVVPADSPYETLDDLLEAITANPSGVPIALGDLGGVDQIFAATLMAEAGADSLAANWVVFSGGGEQLIALLGGQVSAAVTGYAEFGDQIASGELRALVVSGEERLEMAPDVPTVAELGYPGSTMANWRGVFGPPNLTEEERDALTRAFEELAASETWAELLERNAWTDEFLVGDEFVQFVDAEYERIGTALRDLGLAD